MSAPLARALSPLLLLSLPTKTPSPPLPQNPLLLPPPPQDVRDKLQASVLSILLLQSIFTMGAMGEQRLGRSSDLKGGNFFVTRSGAAALGDLGAGHMGHVAAREAYTPLAGNQLALANTNMTAG